jgi:hypothetical protein
LKRRVEVDDAPWNSTRLVSQCGFSCFLRCLATEEWGKLNIGRLTKRYFLAEKTSGGYQTSIESLDHDYCSIQGISWGKVVNSLIEGEE